MINRTRSLLRRMAGALAVLLPLSLTLSCGGVVGSSNASGVQLSDEITFIVPYSPGGGFDTAARVVTPYLEKYLPEGTNIAVKNLPGGNGTIAINEVLSAEPNGQTIGIFNIPGFLVAPLVGRAKYDLTTVEWVGQVAKTTYVAAASPESKVRASQELKALPELDVGVAGLTSTTSVAAQIALKDLGLLDKAEVVPHKGSSEAILSAIRGDMEFVQFPYGSLKEYTVDSQDLYPLWVCAEERLADLPNTPTFEEVGGDPSLLSALSLYRTIGTTPGTPPEILDTLRRALSKAMNDPQLLKEMKKRALEPQYENAEATADTVQSSKQQMKNYKSLFR